MRYENRKKDFLDLGICILYFGIHFQSEDEEMEPTKEMKQSEGEESEQISYSMNFDPTQFVFEHELKIIKVETLDSDVVS